MIESIGDQVSVAPIDREDYPNGGRYTLRVATDGAEMTFSRVSPQLIIIDHTEVADGLRGTGAGQRLAVNAVEDARNGGWKIMPLCPFMSAQAQRHPEWSDVVKR
jgi:uncharacterized protein